MPLTWPLHKQKGGRTTAAILEDERKKKSPSQSKRLSHFWPYTYIIVFNQVSSLCLGETTREPQFQVVWSRGLASKPEEGSSSTPPPPHTHTSPETRTQHNQNPSSSPPPVLWGSYPGVRGVSVASPALEVVVSPPAAPRRPTARGPPGRPGRASSASAAAAFLIQLNDVVQRHVDPVVHR